MKYLLLSLLFVGQTYAVTWNSNGSVSNIQLIHDTKAANGDTITLPRGTFRWTTKLTLTKAITLQGQPGTIVQDWAQAQPKAPLLEWTLVPGQVARLTRIEWQNGGRVRNNQTLFKIVGSNTDGSRFRFDHCTWNQLHGQVRTDGVIGLFDHLDVTMHKTPWCYPWQRNWDGAPYADKSWSDPINWNSDQFLFIEDCTLHGPATTGSFVGGAVDMYNGSRCVIRHNEFYDCTIQTHGTETGGGRTRGHAAAACYENDFIATSPHSGAIALLRSGVNVFHNNRTRGWQDTSISLACYRTFDVLSPFLGADGKNKFDNNQFGAPFYSGTAAAPSSSFTGNLIKVSVSRNPGWPLHKWKGYSIVKTGDVVEGQEYYSVISDSGANYIEYVPALFKRPLAFVSGDPFIITHINHALDQPGVHGGSLITGNPPICPWAAGQNNQLTDPCYSWQNTRTENGEQIDMGNDGNATIRPAVHYVNRALKPGYADYVYPHPLNVP
jgi:hypothetical protein